MTDERVLEILEKSEVLLNGHFILTSGKHSDQYMQCAKIAQYPEYTAEVAKVIVDAFKDDNIDIVVAPAVGGIILGYEVARQLGVKNVFAERENGSMTLRRGFTLEEGKRVLVVEDVVTTGGSVKEVIDIVKQNKCDVVGVGILVDRSNGTVDFGTKFKPVYQTKINAYDKDDCPLCKEGKSEAIKPGSRNLK